MDTIAVLTHSIATEDRLRTLGVAPAAAATVAELARHLRVDRAVQIAMVHGATDQHLVRQELEDLLTRIGRGAVA